MANSEPAQLDSAPSVERFLPVFFPSYHRLAQKCWGWALADLKVEKVPPATKTRGTGGGIVYPVLAQPRGGAVACGL